MPRWGRPPGGATGVGRYFEGVEDDVHRFQELDTDDEKNGVILDRGFQQVSNNTNINPDELYFSDMDIRSWERRASALDGTDGPDYGYQDEDEGYYDDTGESMTHAEYEEMLFRRVLDKIRVARAAGRADVQLSPEEVEAYQSKVYGAKAPAARPHPKLRPSSAFVGTHDAASVITTSKSGNAVSGSSRSKKSQQRTSLFASKPKKEKPSGRKRTPPLSSASSQAAPGFVVPGPDGQPVYAPINAYQGSLVRDAGPVHRPASRSASDTSYQTPTPPRATPRDVLGAFPGSEHAYRPATPPRQGRSTSSWQSMQGHELPPTSRARSASIQSTGLLPFPVEPYQYHTFSPSSSSPTSPQAPQYARRVSSGPSEASYTVMPRRVPVPAPAPVPLQRTAPVASVQGSYSDPTLATQASGSNPGATILVDDQGAAKSIRTVKDGERKRKGGRSKKKG
ncbi:hypothetical protein N0V83_004927 [Neocucurbitaria cava]|uniref:Uncharacterized protein n=1 Tax=Neocucurbitaria cava TaxID=798079 RepID=A0A9W9CMH8_9PLEO|nr:hypothetical protein N0V83_004927 [Neocucurbitaria cava]